MPSLRIPRRCGLLAIVLAVSLASCTQDAGDAARVAPATSQDARAQADAAGTRTAAQAHADLARRLRPFLIERGGATPGRLAADDERLRLGAFWKARRDTHHFNAGFHARAEAILARDDGSAPAADAALRALVATVERRLPDWQAMVDYNASGRLAEDGGDEGRRLLPGCIAAIDAIEAAAWAYVTTAETAAQ
ncbi:MULTISPECIES: hypothetical protein [Luteimonas]|uniref:hypothetical protein n=1 Tax=Luteimonas TaxID=83614 RepID=UPI000C7AA985|nr:MULTISPECIES: hypothetical protein [Luteimonas]